MKHFSNPLLGERCHVALVKKYLAKLPNGALEKDCFYCRPKRCGSSAVPDGPWYDNQPVGHNVLKKKLKEMFESAGLQAETKSNHSLRATGISRLYSAGVPEKLIMERSGHLSKEGVRSYERTTAQQHRTVSALMTTPKGTYNDSLAAPVQQHGPLQDITNSPPSPMAKDSGLCPQDVAQQTVEKSGKAQDVAQETAEKSGKAQDVAQETVEKSGKAQDVAQETVEKSRKAQDVAQEREEKSRKAQEVKDMFSLTGCQVTINMQF